jgi:uncharacterized protein involved in exopolysaccharide biosynthesis
MSLLKSEAAELVYGRERSTVAADVIAAFFRGKRMILGCALILGLIVIAFSILGRHTYQSRMIFLVRSEALTFPATMEEHLDPTLQSASDMQIGTEIELLSGSEIHRQVLSALHPGLSGRATDQQLLSFERALQVTPIPKTSLINVSYTASSPEVADATLATLGRLYLEYRAKIRGSEGAFEFFDKEAKRYYQRLQDDQTKLADFNRQYQVTLMNEEKEVTVRRLAETQSLLYENQASLDEAQRKIQAMSKARETMPPRIVTQRRDLPDQAATGHLSAILVDLQNERVALLTKFHPDDRHVQEVEDKIANIREAIKKSQQSKATEEATDLNPIRQSVDAELQQTMFHSAGMEARKRSLVAEIGAYDAKLQQLNQVTAQYNDLNRSIKDDETTYELYVNKREGARINKTLDTDKIANVRQVSGPETVPQAGISRVLSLLCVYLIGVLLIAGAGILMGLWSRCFHSPAELETAIGLPVLTTVPLLLKSKDDQGSNRVRVTLALSRHKIPESHSSDSIRESEFFRDLDRTRPESQITSRSRYRDGIRSEEARLHGVYLPLIERLRRRDPVRPGVGSVFAFTSCNRGEGVSQFVRGLGAQLTEYTGKKVAIVSALDSYDSVIESPSEAAMESKGRVWTEAPGRSPKGGEEVVKQWFDRLRQNHDYVLVDCPALTVSQAGAVFGHQSDGLLLIVAAGKATRNQLRGALAMLSLSSVGVMGLALNKRRYPIPTAIYNLL